MKQVWTALGWRAVSGEPVASIRVGTTKSQAVHEGAACRCSAELKPAEQEVEQWRCGFPSSEL